MRNGRILTGRTSLDITLGSITVSTASFTMKAGREVIRHILSDGTEQLQFLPEGACELTVTGSALLADGDAGALLTALCGAMRSETAFAFTLAGCTFSDMRISACRLSAKPDAQTAEITLTLIGKEAGA